jgi:hypothetical protein
MKQKAHAKAWAFFVCLISFAELKVRIPRTHERENSGTGASVGKGPKIIHSSKLFKSYLDCASSIVGIRIEVT